MANATAEVKKGVVRPQDIFRKRSTETLAAAHIKLTAEVLEEAMARRTFFFMLQDSMDDEYGLGWARRVMRTFSAALQELERH